MGFALMATLHLPGADDAGRMSPLRGIMGALALLAGVFCANPAAARQDAAATASPGGAGASAAAAQADAAAAPAATGLDPARVDAWLDGLVPYLMAEGDLAGAVVTVVADGQVVTERGFGHADVAKGTPVDAQTTLFRPGSVSKLFVWTSVMQLVEQGKLDLDADINAYLDFEVPRKGGTITLRHVMTHTTGLEERLRHLIVLGAEHPSTATNFIKDRVPDQIFAPGTRPAYSNYATGIAAYIVERMSGQPFEDYVEQHIFAPLDMRHASFRQRLPEALAADASQGYRLGSGKAYPAEKVPSSGVGGLYVSGSAMSRFMLAHLNLGELDGQRILAAQTARQMHTPQAAVLPPLVPMALGWMTSDVGGYPVISHGGTSLFFYSWVYLLPEQNIGLFVSTNSAGRKGAGAALRAQVFERFVETFLPPQALPAAGGSVDEATARQHAAALAAVNWQSTRRSQSSYLKVLGLLSSTRIHSHDDGTISVDGMKGVNGAPLRWREISPWLWQEVDGRDRLAVKVEDGRPVYFAADPTASIMGFEPVPWWRSPGWLRPASMLAMLVLVVTALLRVGGVLTRRHYGIAGPAVSRGLRWQQNLAIVLLLAGCIGWLFYLQSRSGPGVILDPSIAGMVLMHLLSWLALAGAALLIQAAIRQPAEWPRASRVWSWGLALAGLVMGWVVLAHGLATFGLQY